MIYSTQLTTTGSTKVYTSTTTGAPVGGAVTAAPTAITNIILCNTGAPDLTDETVNSALVSIYLCNADVSLTASDANAIVKNLIVPAGETVFFSDERIILNGKSDGTADEIKITASASNLITVTVSALLV